MILSTLLVGCFGGVDLTVTEDSGGGDTWTEGTPVDGVPTDGGVYVLALSTEPSPPVTGKTTLHIRVGAGDTAAPVSGATVVVVPFMPEMGHGISGDTDLLEVGDGRYNAEWFYPMAGEWEVEVSIASELGEDAYTAIFEVG